MEEPHFIKCESVTESSPNLNTEESLPVSVEKIKVEADLVFTDECVEEQILEIVKEELDIQDVKEECIPVLDNTGGPSTKQLQSGVSHADPPPSLRPACFRCDLCGKVLATKWSILQHLKRHTGDRPFKCDHCGKLFSRRSNLSEHVMIHGERPYECSICHKSFLYRRRLSEHMRTHTGKKPFSCTVCGMSFSRGGNLSKHSGIHTGIRLYECSVCNKTFGESGHLARHMRIHTGEKPYHCSICNIQFSQRSSLSTHMKAHTGERPFRCSICSKSFSRRDVFQIHMRRHTGERPYKCKVCEKRFAESRNILANTPASDLTSAPFAVKMCSHKTNLSVHMRSHTGERPYVCAICGKTFAYNNGLSKHLKTHLPQI